MSDDADDIFVPSRTAKDIQQLKETVLRLARDRDRLPQPLFWSLFRSKLKEIKDVKSADRLLDELLGS